MRLRFSNNLLFAQITINYNHQSTSIEVIVDTGSAGTAIDSSKIKPDLRRPGIIADMVGIGGSQQVLIQQVESISIGGIVVENFPIEFTDFESSFEIKGIIGGNLLKKVGAVIIPIRFRFPKFSKATLIIELQWPDVYEALFTVYTKEEMLFLNGG